MHDENSFLRLSYADEHLPQDGSICIRDLQLFMKRLRKHIAPVKVRYYACGEYGDKTWRPHYHVVLFGYAFPDKYPWARSKAGYDLFRSPTLEKLWPFGQSTIGTVTAESGGYVARYAMKKVGGVPAQDHYLRPHPVTGELFQVMPEFALMSSRPGIGGGWFEKFAADVFPSDFLVLNGSKVPVPSYFYSKLKGSEVRSDELVEKNMSDDIRKRRKAFAKTREYDNSPERLAVREELAFERLKQLERETE